MFLRLAAHQAPHQRVMGPVLPGRGTVFGARGYLKEHEVERELRDAMASRIYSGTNEMQRLIVAPLLGSSHC